MKKNKLLLILSLAFVLAACSNDSYVSKRHPDAASEEQVSEALEKPEDEDKDKEESKEDKSYEKDDDAKDEKKEEPKDDKSSDKMAGVTYKVEDVTNIRFDPTTDSDIVGEAHPGDEILVLLEKDGWARVSVNGQSGYIKSDLLKEVK
ncbi:SH3 domain-containing protein [uncultured Anaerococcus sp.]|uniref:SH3 domain-containing protein n=1 Tax=uncultured Anaerococcus sp. TaxID=293428 RepID=UPI002889D888|nr:SH3 domain-containing protein [uncultured Anaerococcus sp.]